MLRIIRKARENERKKIIRPLCLMLSLDLNSACSLVPSDRAELKQVQRNPARKLRGQMASTNDQLHKLWLFSRERYAVSPTQERPMTCWGTGRDWEATTHSFSIDKEEAIRYSQWEQENEWTRLAVTTQPFWVLSVFSDWIFNSAVQHFWRTCN